MKELLGKLISKVYEVNENTEHELLLDYYGGTGGIDIWLYRNGRNVSEELEYFRRIDLKDSDAKEQVEKVLEELEKLEEGDE